MKKRYLLYGMPVIMLVALVWGVAGYLYMQQFSTAQIVARCSPAGNFALCYTDAINAVLKDKGLNAALDTTAAVYDADPKFIDTCHSAMHTLGEAAYDEFSKTKKVELSGKASYCGFGFYHGFMQAQLSTTHDYTEAQAFCHYAGVMVPKPEGYAEGACYHGIGHGVTDGSDPTVWGNAKAMAQPGLDMCSAVASGNAEWEHRCYSGVFNALALLAADPKYKLNMHDDPFFFCTTLGLTPIGKKACYEEMNTLVWSMSGQDIAKSLAYVDAIKDPTFRLEALPATLGVYGARFWSSPTLPQTVAEACSRYSGVFATTCVTGFVDGMIEMGKPGAQHIAVLQLCGSSALTGPMQAACYGKLMELQQANYSAEAIKTICAATPVPYRSKVCTTI